MGISDRQRALVNRVVNPLMVALITHGLGPSTYAVVETTGRRTGRQRLVPVASGLDGDTFWLISGLGDRASYVHNIRANPRVRVRARPARVRDGLRMSWRAGTAHLLPADDARARHRLLGRGRPLYRLDGIILRQLAAGGDMLTIRIDLDPADSRLTTSASRAEMTMAGPDLGDEQPWPWPETMDALLAAPASHRLVMENDQVRVLDVTIEAGAREPEHTHRAASVMIVDQPARIRYYQGDGLLFESQPRSVSQPGVRVRWMEPEGPHSVENIDEHRYHAIRIELK